MVKITKTVKLDLSKMNCVLHRRSDLRESIEKYWLDKQESVVAMQYLTLKDGKIQVPFSIERRDLFLFQVPDICNAFVEPDGRIVIQNYDGVLLSHAEEELIRRAINRELPKHAAFVEEQNLFLNSEPWKQLEGLTPREAVKKLQELGW